MDESSTKEKPKYFDLIRGICIGMACLGLIGSLLLLLILTISNLAAPTIKSMFEEAGVTLLRAILGFIEFVILFIASIWLLRLKETGRRLILIILFINVVEYTYNTAANLTSISLTTYADIVSIALFALDLLLLIFFSRRNVKIYISSNG